MLPIFLKLPSETPSQACEDAEVPQGSIKPYPSPVRKLWLGCLWHLRHRYQQERVWVLLSKHDQHLEGSRTLTPESL